MKAMILAAGLGTRLQPLTNNKPKALVELAGKTLLEIVVTKLRQIGINQIIINTHHFASMIEAFLKDNDNFGIHIEISYEPEILGTGGGLKNAAWFFDDDQPLIMHNVDVLSEVDLETILNFNHDNNALATMVVQQRFTKRYILVDSNNCFIGREDSHTLGGIKSDIKKYAFNGIHIISPELLGQIAEEPPFSIIDTYIHLAKKGQKICCYDMGAKKWWDLGKHDSFRQAQQAIVNREINW